MSKQRLLFFLVFAMNLSTQAFAQFGDCLYQHELEQPTNLIHEVKLPPTAFAKINGGLYNFRIYGVVEGGDTLEMPYAYPNLGAMDVSLSLKQLNAGQTTLGNRFTYELETADQISTLHLEIANKDFEGQVTLEGADRLGDWQQILSDYRIIDLSSNGGSYRFTTLKFRPSVYKYYRITIRGIEKLELHDVTTSRQQTTTSDTIRFAGLMKRMKPIPAFPQTSVYQLDLPESVLVDHLRFSIADTLRYVRFVEVQILLDSVKQGEKFRYRYRTIGSGSISSLDPNQPFGFVATVAKRLRILVHNQDNQALDISEIEAGVQEPRINARFAGADHYFLSYGCESLRRPQYDIANELADMKGRPPTLALAPLNSFVMLSPSDSVEGLFGDPLWFYGALVLVAGLLGWMAIGMMKK